MIKLKKSLGQHFLKSEKIIKDIILAAKVSPDDFVLEIGPGEGILTKNLLQVCGKLLAFEKDHRLIPILTEKFKSEIAAGKFDLMEKDILEFDLELLHSYDRPYKIVANIPYYITGQIIRLFLDSNFQPKSMTLLLQKEVAQRIVAKDGKESLLSLSVKAYGEPKYIRTVGRGAFKPQPNVDSAVLHIENISKENFKNIPEKLFFEVIHAGFAHKRKQLLPNLSELYKKEDLVKIFDKCNIDLNVRAEDLSLEVWTRLCNRLI